MGTIRKRNLEKIHFIVWIWKMGKDKKVFKVTL